LLIFVNDILPAHGRVEFPKGSIGCLFLPASSPPMERRGIRRSENKQNSTVLPKDTIKNCIQKLPFDKINS